jgi:hypothetical protein
MKTALTTIVLFLIVIFEILTGGIIRDIYNPFRMEYNKHEFEFFLKKHEDPKDNLIFYEEKNYYYLDYSPLLLPFNLKKIKIKKDLIKINSPLNNSKINLVRECRNFITLEEKEIYKESLKDCKY